MSDPNCDEATKALGDGQAWAADLRWSAYCLSIIAAGFIGIFLYLMRPVLAPFVVAVFLTVGLKPILELLQRRLALSRIAAVAVAFSVALSLLLFLAMAIASSINQLASDDAYQQRATVATERIASAAERLGLLPSPDSEDGNEIAPNIVRLRRAATQFVKQAQDWLLGAMLSLSGSLGVVVIYIMFLLLGASTSVEASGELWNLIENKLREYIVLKTVVSLGTGVAVWAVLAIFGVPLAVLLGLLTFLLNYVPNFGPLVTCVLPLPIIWLSPELSFGSMITATILACGVQFISGNIIEPRIMGSSFDLHPIVVMLALMAWFALWGFVGMLLAVPITAALKVIFERIDRTAPLARVMAGDLSRLRLGGRETEQ